jgi:RNA polymerase sigma factor (sigma-70 family)
VRWSSAALEAGLSTRRSSIHSDLVVSDWLVLRTALWRVGERSPALKAVSEFRNAASQESTSTPLTASPEYVDASLVSLDAFCTSLAPGRTRSRPDPTADDVERRQALVWLAENQWKNFRLVASGVWRQAGGPSTDADNFDDIVQEFIGLQLPGLLESYDPLLSPLWGYMFFCFKRACWKYVRRQFRNVPSVATSTRDTEDGPVEICDGQPGPEEVIQQKLLAEFVWRLASNLSPRRGQALHLRYTDGLTDEQIGRQLDISSRAARQLVHYAIKELRKTLKMMGLL